MVVGGNSPSLARYARGAGRIPCGVPAVETAIPAENGSLKTLHLTNCWHPSSGGIRTFYKALFEAANREGHFMRLVVLSVFTSVERVGRFGRIYNIEAPRAPFHSDYRMALPHGYLFPRTALQRIVNEERPDLIEVSDKYVLPYLAGRAHATHCRRTEP